MAFASTISEYYNQGSKKVTRGTFTNGAGDSGGDIDTGLEMCQFIELQQTGAAAVATAPAVNETLPAAGSAITIVTTAGADGNWRAEGY
jgi:hypothetical protein